MLLIAYQIYNVASCGERWAPNKIWFGDTGNSSATGFHHILIWLMSFFSVLLRNDTIEFPFIWLSVIWIGSAMWIHIVRYEVNNDLHPHRFIFAGYSRCPSLSHTSSARESGMQGLFGIYYHFKRLSPIIPLQYILHDLAQMLFFFRRKNTTKLCSNRVEVKESC